jgi:hypothetical protein
MEKKRQRVPFTTDEDIKLITLVKLYGFCWEFISKQMKNRSVRQCKERWDYFLNPDIKKGNWTEEEDRIIIEKHKELGSSWKEISKYLKNRTQFSVRNRFKQLLKDKSNSKNNSIDVVTKDSDKIFNQIFDNYNEDFNDNVDYVLL